MDVDRMINDINGKYLPFDHKTKGKGVLNLMCNPIQLVDIIFPKEHLNCIVNTLGGNNLAGGETSKKYPKYIKWIRKLAKLKPIENIDEKVLKLPIHNQNVEIIGIGIKEDGELPDGTEAI